jgi:scyllo-inositol 2-dehydrogenase (NADP+)
MVTDPAPIRVALIGHGLAGAYFHARPSEAALARQLVAVATSSRDSRSLRRDAPRAVADPAAACRLDDVELVVIATPNETHFSLASIALGAGKHVVIDKPMVLSTREADELIALAARQRALLTVFHNRGASTAIFSLLTELLPPRRGSVRVMLFESRWDRFRPEVALGWRNEDVPGAGLLWTSGAPDRPGAVPVRNARSGGCGHRAAKKRRRRR